jgi:hypothetical protein
MSDMPRAEAVASSWIEGLTIGVRRLARAGSECATVIDTSRCRSSPST